MFLFIWQTVLNTSRCPSTLELDIDNIYLLMVMIKYVGSCFAMAIKVSTVRLELKVYLAFSWAVTVLHNDCILE